MGDKVEITLVSQPQDFFRELVTQALSRQKLCTKPETEFYLVNLLNQFMTTDRLYVFDSNGSARQEPLALMVKEALEQGTSRQQSLLFRHVGDVSLYTAGFFQDSLSRKCIDIDYYIEMGGTAYQQVASRMDDNALRQVYSELSDRFALFVEVLAAVSDQTTAPKTEKDILRLYEQWVRTKSERAAKALQEAGILPNDNLKKDLQ
ncbi:MAG: hypothetical protein HYX41_05670 [Bdellovibrio sp.]|nr:hypothetical protein [Bdellovibrio sp.]